jgi:hypothetical protein
MSLIPFHKILYGPQRPWIIEERTGITADNPAAHAKTAEKRYSAVRTSPPPDRASLNYTRLIDQYENEALRHIVKAVDQKDNEIDKIYLIERTDREIEELIKETGEIPIPDTSAHYPVTAFVFNNLRLTLVNLLINLRLRYHGLCDVETRHDVSLHNHPTTAEEIYLTLLDRQPPDPSPFYRTAAWYPGMRTS